MHALSEGNSVIFVTSEQQPVVHEFEEVKSLRTESIRAVEIIELGRRTASTCLAGLRLVNLELPRRANLLPKQTSLRTRNFHSIKLQVE